MSTRVKMLTTATGPELHCDAGKVYDLPDALAKDFLQTKQVKAVDVVIEDGKERKTERIIGTVGPFALLCPDAPTKSVCRNWKRNPKQGADDE